MTLLIENACTTSNNDHNPNLTLTLKNNTKTPNPNPNPNLMIWRQGTRKLQSIVVLSPKIDNLPFNVSQ